MAKGKNVFTTGDVAKICNVAPRTVSKWFDAGHLKGYRIPGSKDRRIPISELVRFMKAHEIPLSSLQLSRKIRVLIVDSDKNSASALSKRLLNKTDYDVQTVGTNFETGVVAMQFSPHVMLVNLSAKDIDGEGICEAIHKNPDFATIKIIAIADNLSGQQTDALLRKGFESVVGGTSEIAEIIKQIEQATAIVY